MSRIDSRAWMTWAVAGMLPALLGRNPILLLELLIVVFIVHVVWSGGGRFLGVRWFVRIAATFSVIGVLFNVLTVHAGSAVFGQLPDTWPVIGGNLTWNALAYGIASGTALFTLVLIGTTVGSMVAWLDVFTVLPRRLAPIAMAGSVAWAFLPQTAVAFQQIRESQELRGHRLRGVRGMLPLIVPLLAGALERSLSTAEALEARGFGVSRSQASHTSTVNPVMAISLMGSLVLLLSGAFCALAGFVWIGMVVVVIGTLLFGLALWLPDPHSVPRTRYHQAYWTWRETAVTAGAVGSGLGTLLWAWIEPQALQFEPYPEFDVPVASVPLMLSLALLLVPALIIPDSVMADAPEGVM